MSFSAFYAVRFSPAPELGEWLNVAVVGEGITDKKAGIVVTASLKRIEAAFGEEAVERVVAISKDLTDLVAIIAKARERGEETQPITTAMRDHALSLSFSDQIVVFEGTFEDGLASVAKKYLANPDSAEVKPNKVEATVAERPKKEEERSPEILKIANSLQDKLAKFSKEIFPAGVTKTLKQGQKAIESIVHGPDVSTVLVIGAASHLGSALIPKLVEGGKRVRLMEDPAMEGVDAIVYVPDHLHHVSEDPAEIKACAESAKHHGVKKFVYAVPCGMSETSDKELEESLQKLGGPEFAVTILRLGEPYGHAKESHWFGDLHDPSGALHKTPSVNVLTAQAVLTGKVSAVDTDLRLFLHVEDAAASILAVLDARSETVNGQIYTVGSEDQIRTVSEIVELIKHEVPNADYVVTMGEGEGLSTPDGLHRMYQELGFAPAQTMEEGIARLVAALKDGSFGRYMATQNLPHPEATTLDPTIAIQWEKLTITSPKIEMEDTPTDESLRHL